MKKGERLLYQDNKLGYQFALCFIILNTVVTIGILRSMTINIRIGSFVMFNIILSLVSFLMSMKLKKYSMDWGVFAIILGVIQTARAFILPEANANVLMMILTVASAVFSVAGGIATIRLANIRRSCMAGRQS